MTDNMVLMWKDLMGTMLYGMDQDLVKFVFYSECSQVSLESFIEHMMLEFCKYTYFKKTPKHPLRYYMPYDASDNTDRMTYTRTMKYAQKFKDRNYSILEKLSDNPESYAELKPKPMDSISARKEGYELSEMDIFENDTIHRLELIKAIAENRIYSSKKVPNSRFIEMFLAYDEWVKKLITRSLKGNEDLVFASIAFFTFEWKYSIEYYYKLTNYLIDNNIDSLDFFLTWLFTGSFHFDSALGTSISADSRFIKDRIELIPVFFDPKSCPSKIEIQKHQYLEMLTLKTLMLNSPCTEGGKYVDWFANNTSMADMASFFKDYDIFQIWQPKTFSNIQIKKMRYVLETSSTFNKEF